MKVVIRRGVFETNSSSEHAFIVFDDLGLQDAWMGDPDIYLDLRGAEWVDGYELYNREEIDDYPVETVTPDMLVNESNSKWPGIMEDIRDYYGDEIEEFGVEYCLMHRYVISSAALGKWEHDYFIEQGIDNGWGSEILCDDAGRDVFHITRSC